MTQPTSTLPPITGTPDWGTQGWAPPTPPAPPAKRKIGRYIAGGVALLFVIGIASGGDKKKDASSSDGLVTTPTTPPATSAATTRSTTASAPATVSVASWASRYGSSDAAALGADLSALEADAGAMNLSSMSSSCRTMQRHIATAKSHLPTPDAQLTSALSDTYGYYGQAMTLCISGAATADIDDLTEMTSYITLATSSIQRATARMQTLS